MEKNQTSCPRLLCEKIYRAITLGPAFSTIHRISIRKQTLSPAKHARNPSLPKSDTPMIKTKLTSPQRPKPTGKEGSEVPIKFDYTTRLPTPPTEKPKPITALNGSTQTNGQVPLACMAQQAKAPKLSTDMVQSGKPIVPGNGQQAQNKSKPKTEKSNGQIQVQIERHQANKEEGRKPTQHYDDTFSAYIYQTKKRIMSNDQDYGENSPKVVGHGHGGIGKDHHFSDYIDQAKRKIRTTSSIKDRSEYFIK
ncbi:hypothetical protein CRYUN_Cryun23aG0092100 [Craigia yunnanensis]